MSMVWAIVGTSLLVTLFIIGTITLVFSSLVTRPLAGLTSRIVALSDGDIESKVPSRDRKDEIGSIAAALVGFCDQAAEMKRLEKQTEEAQLQTQSQRAQSESEQAEAVQVIGSALERLAQGDLNAKIHADMPAGYEQLKVDFNAAVQKLAFAVSNVVSSIGNMRSGSQEISKAAMDLSRRTKQQAASVEEASATLAQINTSVTDTASTAKEARSVVDTAASDAEQSGQVVAQTIEAMKRIEASSEEMGKIINVIDELAFQTNLLALNAGVEAARAGEAGRGFAVVASEVRGLADRSATAAKDISNLIAASVTEVEAGSSLVSKTGDSLAGISDKIITIATMIAEMSESASDQSSQLGEVTMAVSNIDRGTQENAAVAEQSTAACQSLLQQSGQLSELVQQFKLGGPTQDQLRRELESVAPHAFAKQPQASGSPQKRATSSAA